MGIETVLSDEALMRTYQTTLDADVFERLIERYWARGFAVALRLLGDRHAAEDALQESCMRLLRSSDSYNSTQPFACWFYAILRNACMDQRRRKRCEADAVAAREQWDLSRDEPCEDVSELLADLAPADRDVLLLRIVQGLSFAEIAAALGCSEEAARKRGQRALRRLRARCVCGDLLKI